VRLYREHIEQIYLKGRKQWDYLVPEAPEERAVLRSLCARTPAFENHREYLHMELLHGDPELAKQRLQGIIFPDD
jgi:hypothetical protein